MASVLRKLLYRESPQLYRRDRRLILTNPLTPWVDLRPSAIPPILSGLWAVVGLLVSVQLEDADEIGNDDGDGVVGDGDFAAAAVIAAVVAVVAVAEQHPPPDTMYIPVVQVQSEDSRTAGLGRGPSCSRTKSH